MTAGRRPRSPSPDSSAQPLPPAFWAALESVPGGSALHTIWKRHLGPDLETFTSLFLKQRPGEPAQFVPSPWTSPFRQATRNYRTRSCH